MYHFFEHERHARFFEKGDLKYIILDLISAKPMHGYEIIRALENRFHGFYSPSAGSVYPTLQLLEDMGYVKAVEQDGKKVYTITDEGKKFLREQEETTDRIKGRMHDWWHSSNREDFREIFHELRDTLFLLGRKHHEMSAAKINRIKEVVKKTTQDIKIIVEERD